MRMETLAVLRSFGCCGLRFRTYGNDTSCNFYRLRYSKPDWRWSYKSTPGKTTLAENHEARVKYHRMSTSDLLPKRETKGTFPVALHHHSETLHAKSSTSRTRQIGSSFTPIVTNR